VLNAMNIMRHWQRFVVYLCLAAILLAALTHTGTDLPVILLAAFWILFGLTVIVPAPAIPSSCAIQLAPILPVCSPRPPPTR
jgi:hypothetical protein